MDVAGLGYCTTTSYPLTPSTGSAASPSLMTTSATGSSSTIGRGALIGLIIGVVAASVLLLALGAFGGAYAARRYR